MQVDYLQSTVVCSMIDKEVISNYLRIFLYFAFYIISICSLQVNGTILIRIVLIAYIIALLCEIMLLLLMLVNANVLYDFVVVLFTAHITVILNLHLVYYIYCIYYLNPMCIRVSI